MFEASEEYFRLRFGKRFGSGIREMRQSAQVKISLGPGNRFGGSVGKFGQTLEVKTSLTPGK